MFNATTKNLFGSLTTSAPKKKYTPSPATPGMGPTTAPTGTMSTAVNLDATPKAPRKSEGGLRLRMSLHPTKRQVAPLAAVTVDSLAVPPTSTEVFGGAAVLSALASRYVAAEDTFQQGDQIFQDLLPELGGQGLSRVLENLYLSDAKAGDQFMELVDPDDLPRGPALGHLVATRCLVSPKDGARMLNEFHKRLTTRAAGNEGLQIAVEALCLADPELGKVAVETYVDQLEPSAVLMDAGEGKAVRKEDIESRTAKRWAQRRAELAEGLWGLVPSDPKTARGLGGQAFAAPAA